MTIKTPRKVKRWSCAADCVPINVALLSPHQAAETFPPVFFPTTAENFPRKHPNAIYGGRMQENGSTTQALLDLIGEAAFDDIRAVFGGFVLCIHKTDACLMRLAIASPTDICTLFGTKYIPELFRKHSGVIYALTVS